LELAGIARTAVIVVVSCTVELAGAALIVRRAAAMAGAERIANTLRICN
jgi:hypothetical protein